MGNELDDRLRGMSDEDLLDMIDRNPDDYTPEAISAAKKEAERRGGVDKLYEIVDAKFQQIAEQEEQSRLAEEAVEAEAEHEDTHGLLSYGFFSGTRTLKDETLSEVQFAIIRDAADQANQVIADIKKKLEASSMPLDCRWGVVEVKTKGWVSRVRRDFLIVELSEFPDYHTYISIRKFGTYLDCMRALTIEPGFVKKFLSKKLTGDEEALSAPKNILKHQDLNTWNGIVKDCMEQAIDELLDRLGRKPGLVQRGEKKFLDIW